MKTLFLACSHTDRELTKGDQRCPSCKYHNGPTAIKKSLMDKPFEILNLIFYPRNTDRTPENFSWPTERIVVYGQR